MKTSISLLIALPILLMALEPMDLEMTPQDKKKTGVFKLSKKEKASLQGWIDNNYEKRSQPLTTPPPKTPKPNLSENLYNGSYIRLSDNTLWNIRPQDTPITQGWITPVEIVVTPSQDQKYPYRLTNSLTGSSVLAKKATQLPTPKPGDVQPHSTPITPQSPTSAPKK